MEEITTTEPLTAVSHLPPSLKCRDCQQSVAFMLQAGQVKVYCSLMHLVSYVSQESDLITDCSKYQPPGQE